MCVASLVMGTNFGGKETDSLFSPFLLNHVLTISIGRIISMGCLSAVDSLREDSAEKAGARPPAGPVHLHICMRSLHTLSSILTYAACLP